MTRAQMRTLLRRRLREVVADQWADSDLDELLNTALAWMQTMILALDPDANLVHYAKDLTADDYMYETPASMITPIAVEIKDADGVYRKASKMKFADLLARQVDSVEGDGPRYARFGRAKIAISPTPSSNVSQGIRFTFVNLLTMGADTDVPSSVPLNLHLGIVYKAEIIAVGEGREAVKDTQIELNSMVQGMTGWYLPSGDELDTIDFDLGKDKLY